MRGEGFESRVESREDKGRGIRKLVSQNPRAILWRQSAPSAMGTMSSFLSFSLL